MKKQFGVYKTETKSKPKTKQKTYTCKNSVNTREKILLFYKRIDFDRAE